MRRYDELYAECKKRGFKVTFFGDAFGGPFPNKLWNDYTPTEKDTEIVRERIKSKLENKKK